MVRAVENDGFRKSGVCVVLTFVASAWHQGELVARFGFIVTNLRRRCKRMVRFY